MIAGVNIVQDLLSVVALAIGLPGIITWFLNRKGANKKLELDEDAQTDATYRNQAVIYDQLMAQMRTALADAQTATTAANTAAEAADTQARKSLAAVTETNQKLDSLRRLLVRLVGKLSYTMTPEEQSIFDATKPSNTRSH